MKQNNLKKEKGFTLIETLVSIFILLVAITGPLTFSQSGLRASFLARDQIVAFYLAQDVIETIKHLRDNYMLNITNTGHWLTLLEDCQSNSVGDTVVCIMDTGGNSQITTDVCNNDECPSLTYNSSTRTFGYSGDSISKYTRTIYVTEVVPEREAQIVVKVEWDSNFFATRRVIVQENIYNWVPLILNR